MSERALSVSVEKVGGRSVFRLAGDLVDSAQEDLDAAYDSADGAGTIVLDFEEVGFIDSTGIAVLLRLLRRAMSDGRGVSAVGLNDHYREVFDLTHVSEFMTVEPRPGPGRE
ncbi:MAG: STAS domain-containing protein [Actinomycetota bacterium]